MLTINFHENTAQFMPYNQDDENDGDDDDNSDDNDIKYSGADYMDSDDSQDINVNMRAVVRMENNAQHSHDRIDRDHEIGNDDKDGTGDDVDDAGTTDPEMPLLVEDSSVSYIYMKNKQ